MLTIKRDFLRIAIAESESVAAANIRQNLEESGYSITGVYSSGKEAVKNIPDSGSDLIIMDVLLNGAIDGIDTAERIMLIKNIPVIFIIRPGDKKFIPRIILFNNYGILYMPFTRDDLLNSVERVYYKYVKSINFYRDCRNLILEINPYKADFIKNINLLIDLLDIHKEGKTNSMGLANILNEVKTQMPEFINSEKVTILRSRHIERSIYSIIKYTDNLLGEIDTLNTKDIKNYLNLINLYLKVLLTS